MRAAILVSALLAVTGCGGNGAVMETHPIDAIATRADTLIFADVPVVTQAGVVRVEADCSGTTCDLSESGLDVGDVSLADLVGPSNTSQTLPDKWPGEFETYNGVSVIEATETSPEGDAFLTLGGWLDHSFFLAGAGTIRDTGSQESVTLPVVFSAGVATGTNPVEGSASWSGAMIGIATGGGLRQVRGDADLTVDLAGPAVDVAFTKIKDASNNARADMAWSGIPLIDGAFETAAPGNTVQGAFYGPAHEEAGGVFERDQAVGAFGAKRR